MKRGWPALVAAAALLLGAPHAFASRTASQRPELLVSSCLQPITATQAVAPAYIPQGFALRLDTDPHPATFGLFNDLTPAPEHVEPEKLVSGVESWALTPNLQRIQRFVTDSRWCREFLGPIDSPNLYQAFGLDPMNMTDPLGLCRSCADFFRLLRFGDRVVAAADRVVETTAVGAKAVGTRLLETAVAAGDASQPGGMARQGAQLSVHVAIRVAQSRASGGTVGEALAVTLGDATGFTAISEGVTGWEVYGDQLTYQERVERIAGGAFDLGLTTAAVAGGVSAVASEARSFRLFSDQLPMQPYNRSLHYGKTPTRADRSTLGAGPGDVVDHNPPLVKRYYEGDPATGESPGFLLTPEERLASARDRSRMRLQPKSDSNRQGAEMQRYSLEKKKEFGLDQ